MIEPYRDAIARHLGVRVESVRSFRLSTTRADVIEVELAADTPPDRQPDCCPVCRHSSAWAPTRSKRFPHATTCRLNRKRRARARRRGH